MSADCAAASRFTLLLITDVSMLTASRPAPRIPNCSVSRYAVTTSELAMKVLDGTQSCSTQAPPAPSASTTVTSAPSWAATRAASYPAGPPPMITIRATPAPPNSTPRLSRGRLTPHRSYGHCRPPAGGAEEWIQTRHAPQYSPPDPVGFIVIAVRHYAAYGSNLDPARMRAYCPYSPMVGTGWLEGWRLTFAGEDILGWEGAVTTIVESPGDRVFVALYDIHPQDEKQLDEVEGIAHGTYRQL